MNRREFLMTSPIVGVAGLTAFGGDLMTRLLGREPLNVPTVTNGEIMMAEHYNVHTRAIEELDRRTRGIDASKPL